MIGSDVKPKNDVITVNEATIKTNVKTEIEVMIDSTSKFENMNHNRKRYHNKNLILLMFKNITNVLEPFLMTSWSGLTSY
jgi:hypothetical protein